MKIHYHRYQHDPLPGYRCEGAVLRVTFGAYDFGYCDIHPWESMGEETCTDLLAVIAAGEINPLVAKSLHFAVMDAKARRQSRNLLIGLRLPNSHALLTSIAKDQIQAFSEEGFGSFKVKVSDEFLTHPEMIEAFPKDARIRLDFKGQRSYQQFRDFWDRLPADRQAQVEVVEDPWLGTEAGSRDLPCYGDWLSHSAWAGRVFKPARTYPWLEYRAHRYSKVMFTHSLDHPIGQAAALWEAAKFYQSYPSLIQTCGFSLVPGFDDYYDQWKWHGPIRRPAPGTGFGFDTILQDLKWEKLS